MKVYLVGAGPGDPGLLTIKGKKILERADSILYDHLANDRLLDLAPPAAERVYVGKKRSPTSSPRKKSPQCSSSAPAWDGPSCASKAAIPSSSDGAGKRSKPSPPLASPSRSSPASPLLSASPLTPESPSPIANTPPP